MSDIGADFFSFPGGVNPNAGAGLSGSDAATSTISNGNAAAGGSTTSASAAAAAGASGGADGLWYNEGLESYDNTDGVITHIAAKASGSCPYMRELLGLPPLPSAVTAAATSGANGSANPIGEMLANTATSLGLAALTPPLRANGLNDSFANNSDFAQTPPLHSPSPSTLSMSLGGGAQPPPHHHHQHHHLNTSSNNTNSNPMMSLGMGMMMPSSHPPVKGGGAAAAGDIGGCPFLSKRRAAAETAAAAAMPPLPSSMATLSPAGIPNTDMFSNSNSATPVKAGKCPFGYGGSAPSNAAAAVTGAADAVVGKCPITGKVGPIPRGHPTSATTPTTAAPPPMPMMMGASGGGGPPVGLNTSAMQAMMAAHGGTLPPAGSGCPFAAKAAGVKKTTPPNLCPTLDTNPTVSSMAVVAITAPAIVPEGAADPTTSHKCPFINVFANHIDSFLHRALMTSVLNRITLKSFLREKKVLQKFAINSAAIRKRDRIADNAMLAVDGENAVAAAADDVDESVFNVCLLDADAVEEKCTEILQIYLANGTARPRIVVPAITTTAPADASASEKLSAAAAPTAVITSAAPPKLTPAVAAILAAAAANDAYLPAALRQKQIGAATNNSNNTASHQQQNLLNVAPTAAVGADETAESGRRSPSVAAPATPNTRPQSGASTPSMKPRRIGDICDEQDATAGATPSAVASMLSSMRLGKEVSLPMGLSFLNQATTRSEERYTDMYLRVVSEGCGIKTSITPPLKPPAKLLGPDGQPNPAAMMVMVPSSSLLARALGDGRPQPQQSSAANASTLPNGDAEQPTAAPNSAVGPTVAAAVGGAMLQPVKASTVAPPKTFLHDVLCALFVPRMRHFYTLWLHAVEKYEELAEEEEGANTAAVANDGIDEKEQLALADAVHRINSTADDLIHCLRSYARMLHYHIMDPSSMKAVIEELIAKADAFVAGQAEKAKVKALRKLQKEKEQQQQNGVSPATPMSTKAIHVYPSAHRFFALATIFAIRESVPFRSLIAMEVGDGADLRENIVAELIRGEKIFQMGNFVEKGTAHLIDVNGSTANAASPSSPAMTTVAPGYAHPSAARNVIKAALYSAALATISPVAVLPTSTSTSVNSNGGNTAAAPPSVAPNAPKGAAANAKGGDAKSAAAVADGPSAPAAATDASAAPTPAAANKPASKKTKAAAAASDSNTTNKETTTANKTAPTADANAAVNKQTSAAAAAPRGSNVPTHTLMAANAVPFTPSAAAPNNTNNKHINNMVNTNTNHNMMMMNVAPFTNVPMNAQQPLMVPFAPFLQYQQHMQQQQHQQQQMMLLQQQHQQQQQQLLMMQQHQMMMMQQQHQQVTPAMPTGPLLPPSPVVPSAAPAPQAGGGSASSVLAAHYAAMQEAAARHRSNNNSGGGGAPANSTNAEPTTAHTPASPTSPSDSTASLSNGPQPNTATAAPQQRCQVPPFYSQASSPSTAAPPQLDGSYSGSHASMAGGGSSSVVGGGSNGNSMMMMQPPAPHPAIASFGGTAAGSPVSEQDSAASSAQRCPFLRAQFPSGAPALIPSNGSANVNAPQQQQPNGVIGGISGDAKPFYPQFLQNNNNNNNNAAPPMMGGGGANHFYPLYYPVVPTAVGGNHFGMMMGAAPQQQQQQHVDPFGANNSTHNANGVVAPPQHAVLGPLPIHEEELIAPVFRPKGNGIALRPPPYTGGL